jgi:WD40 repeat protein
MAAGATLDDNAVVLCDLDGRTTPIRVPCKWPRPTLTFGCDDRYVGIDEGSTEELLIAETSTGHVQYRVPYRGLFAPERGSGVRRRFLRFALAPHDGRLAASLLCFYDYIHVSFETVATWDPERGLNARASRSWFDTISLSPDGGLFATWIGNEIRLLYAPSMALHSSILGHREIFTCVGFSWDGARLASGDNGGSVRIWDVATSEELLSLEGHTTAVRFVQFSRDGKTLVSIGDRPDGSTEIFFWRAGRLTE